ncbi:MAG: hypothetical protein ACREB9_03355 [Thermoplasmata archaeon]
MPRRSTSRAKPRSRKLPSTSTADDFAAALERELGRVEAAVAAEERTERKDLGHRGQLNRRLLQDLWEVHNRFEQISVHLTLEPAATLFATFAEYPTQFTLRENFDFGALTAIELADRAQGWIGYGLRFWYYRDAEGRGRLRGIFEWTEGETYHRYAGWMRTINQAVVVDSIDHEVDVGKLQGALREIAVKWYSAHLNRNPASLVEYLKGHFPAGASYTKESYR